MYTHARTDALIRLQDGVISRDQALELGLSPRQVQTLVKSGRWIKVIGNVYRGGQHELAEAGWVRSVVLWAGRDAVLSGAAAAWWWDLCDSFNNVVEIAIPPDRYLVPPVTHRHRIRITRRFIASSDRTQRRNLLVPTLPIAVLLGVLDLKSAGPQMMDRALQRRVSLGQLQNAANHLRGATGSKEIARLLKAAADGAAADSERMLIQLLKDAGITGWVVNRTIWTGEGRRTPDILFHSQRVVVEVDGWAFHHDVERFGDDRRRQNSLVLGDWIVLRFTWHDLYNEPARVIAEIRQALLITRND